MENEGLKIFNAFLERAEAENKQEVSAVASNDGLLSVGQNAIDRMAKAYDNGKGVRLSHRELHSLSCSIIGEWFVQDNPCK